MSGWIKIGPITKYKKTNQWLVKVNNRPVALFLYKNQYYAIKNSCAHQGYPLAEGNLKDYMIECPLHGWVYDIRDGKCLSLKTKHTITYQVRERNNFLEIKLN